jgi:hypothetical protein
MKRLLERAKKSFALSRHSAVEDMAMLSISVSGERLDHRHHRNDHEIRDINISSLHLTAITSDALDLSFSR